MAITPVVGTDPVSPLENLFNTQATALEAEMAAALNYLSTADLSSLHVITPTAGLSYVVLEGGALFTGNGTIFVQTTKASFASSSARDTAYAKASGAYKVTGVTCSISTAPLVTLEYNGTAWQKRGIVKPTVAAATGGTATINDDGSVTFVSTGAGNVILTNCFMPKANYDTDNFDVEVSGSGSASTYIMKLASSGTADPSTTTYDYYGNAWSQAGTASAQTALAGANWPLSSGQNVINCEATMELRHPGEAAVTRGWLTDTAVTTLGTAELYARPQISNKSSTVFDGLQLLVTAAVTVTIKVKPRV